MPESRRDVIVALVNRAFDAIEIASIGIATEDEVLSACMTIANTAVARAVAASANLDQLRRGVLEIWNEIPKETAN